MARAEAAEAVREANDLTNDLLRANADGLRQANRETREQIERGVFDIQAVGEANRMLPLVSRIADDIVADVFADGVRRDGTVRDITSWVWGSAFAVTPGPLPEASTDSDALAVALERLGRLDAGDRR